MTAEILCVGTELLLGEVVNTNASYIAKKLAENGINVFHQGVIGDNVSRLKKELELCFSRSDILIMTGGLGPTFDDLTKETVAEYFGVGMEMHQPSLEHIENFFKGINHVMTENNKKQAMMPIGATVFHNDNGTAPGLAITKNGKTVIMMPGPPREMQPMMDEKVIPYLQQYTDSVLVSSNVHVFGLGESRAEDMLKDYMMSMTNPTIAPYAKTGEMYLRVTAKAKNKEKAYELLNPVIKELKDKLGKFVYGIDIPDLQTAVYLALKENNLTLSTAESCTGGLISKMMTDISGASDVFMGGVCTYANKAKTDILGVKEETLQKYGAVSAKTAMEMALGAKKVFGTDIAIATTGIAGPTGGTDEKPVGLVYVGIAYKDKVFSEKLMLFRNYKNPRDVIRQSAALNALMIALKTIKEI